MKSWILFTPLKIPIGENLNKRFMLSRLKVLGLTQRDVAKKLHRHPAVINVLIKGERELKAREVKPLAELLQVSPLDILNNLR